MHNLRPKTLIDNPQPISRRHMLSLGAAVMAAAGLSQQLGIISAAHAQAFLPEEFQGLIGHVVYRMTIHCVPPLGFDPDATLAARNWAANSPQGINAQGQVTFAHDPNRGAYGENMAWGTNLTATDAIALWYEEGKLYNYNTPGFSTATGHFTQFVWASSRLLGMSVARRGNVNLWVARYFPAGNIAGQFPNNVFPPLGGPLCAHIRVGTSSQSAIGVVPPAPEPLTK
jgi:glioma pathogenesis-related protein 2